MADYRERIGKSSRMPETRRRMDSQTMDGQVVQTGASAGDEDGSGTEIQIDYYKLLDIMITGAASGVASAIAINMVLGEK